jgi:hypothetical protein
MSGVSITPEGRLEADLQTIERLKALCAEDAAGLQALDDGRAEVLRVAPAPAASRPRPCSAR